MIASVPISAPGTPPDTGASIHSIPASSFSRAAMSRVASGWIEEKSTRTEPLRAPLAIPVSPKTASRTAAVSVRHMNTMSDFAATSAALAPRVAPRCTSGSAFSAVRFQTVTGLPASISRVAIGAPIRPVPM